MVRFASAVAAGQMKLVDAYQPLEAMAYDPSPQVQAGVRFALHRLGDTRLSHDLERLAGNTDPHVRGTTAFVVGLLREPSAAKMLTTLLADPVARRCESRRRKRFGASGIKEGWKIWSPFPSAGIRTIR